MKDAKQFFSEFMDNDILRNKISEGMRRFIESEGIEPWQAGREAAFELGYDIPDEVAKTIVIRMQGISDDDLKELSEEEAKAIASGDPHLPACC